MLRRNHERGDTLIEVILAFAVFSMLAVGSIILMNQGTQSAQFALEITQTQKTIAAQEETLKYLRDEYAANQNGEGASAVMRSIVADPVTNLLVTAPSTYGDDSCSTTLPAKAFVLNPTVPDGDPITPIAMADDTAPAFPQVNAETGRAYGVWIEAVRGDSAAGQPGFVDFHIRACWTRPAGDGAATTGTILRLYMPYLTAASIVPTGLMAVHDA